MYSLNQNVLLNDGTSNSACFRSQCQTTSHSLMPMSLPHLMISGPESPVSISGNASLVSSRSGSWESSATATPSCSASVSPLANSQVQQLHNSSNGNSIISSNHCPPQMFSTPAIVVQTPQHLQQQYHQHDQAPVVDPFSAIYGPLIRAAPFSTHLRMVRRANVGGHSEVVLCSTYDGCMVALKAVPVDQPGRKSSSIHTLQSAFRTECAILERITAIAHNSASYRRSAIRVVRSMGPAYSSVISSDIACKGAEHGLCCLHFTPHAQPMYRDYCGVCSQHKKEHIPTTSRLMVMCLECVPNGDLCEYTERIDGIRKAHGSVWKRHPALQYMDQVACILFSQILEALDFLHNDVKVCHRDVKPDNIGLDEHWNVKVFDFGHAVAIPFVSVSAGPNTPAVMEEGHLTDGICGTNDYAPPEALAGLAHSGTAADLWSAGTVLLRLLGFRLRQHPQAWVDLFQDPVNDAYWATRFTSHKVLPILRAIFAPENVRSSVRAVQNMVYDWAVDLGLRDSSLVALCQQVLASTSGKRH
eukprot:ANDGO_07151.mRNA.1 Serine/threonine kinase SAD-1